jgi:hypothetical protein
MEPTPDIAELSPEEEAALIDGGEEFSDENSSPAGPMDEESFNSRVEKLLEMMDADPKVRDRLLAEMYVNMASAEQGIRGMFEAFQTQGFAGMMRGAFRRG